eukprot:gnl/Carplike_NY0171/4107_a5555_338.p1 GENE.gnl/Carplike_NY0171/4107_a5555_338~~gnl/Carplike_NY0171/4107_a5555_338.p1  ORF type:complete len:604 (+),score=162.77 gnl/Carplike_NY0171/4107_a5555_338:187-1812(+)
MEDAHCAVFDVISELRKSQSSEVEKHLNQVEKSLGHAPLCCFGVFDGHCGAEAAQMAAAQLWKVFSRREELIKGDIEEAWVSAFKEMDDSILAYSRKTGNISGTTACVAALHGDNVTIANSGDSRAVLFRGGRCEDLSTDHKPSRLSEKKRIKEAGGDVHPTLVQFGAGGPILTVGPDRVWPGGLALSRGLGDINFKDLDHLSTHKVSAPLVSYVPEITRTQLWPVRDEAIIIACDGLWDVVSTEALGGIIKRKLPQARREVFRIFETYSFTEANTKLASLSMEQLSSLLFSRMAQSKTVPRLDELVEASYTDSDSDFSASASMERRDNSRVSPSPSTPDKSPSPKGVVDRGEKSEEGDESKTDEHQEQEEDEERFRDDGQGMSRAKKLFTKMGEIIRLKSDDDEGDVEEEDEEEHERPYKHDQETLCAVDRLTACALANYLTNYAIRHESSDNVSVMVILLRWPGTDSCAAHCTRTLQHIYMSQRIECVELAISESGVADVSGDDTSGEALDEATRRDNEIYSIKHFYNPTDPCTQEKRE